MSPRDPVSSSRVSCFWEQRRQGLGAQEYGVFMRVGDVAGAPWRRSACGLKRLWLKAGWTLLAAYDAGVDAKRLLVLGSSPCGGLARIHTGRNVPRGPRGLRRPRSESLFSRMSSGVHVAAVNPRSTEPDHRCRRGDGGGMGTALRRSFGERCSEGVGATPSFGDFGQFRDKGRIGRTMGVMAGGPFVEKFKLIGTWSRRRGEPRAVAKALYEAMTAAGAREGLGHPARIRHEPGSWGGGFRCHRARNGVPVLFHRREGI